MLNLLVLQFVCDVVKDTGKEEYLCPFVRIGLDFNKCFQCDCHDNML